jgi:hypothetical protein
LITVALQKDPGRILQGAAREANLSNQRLPFSEKGNEPSRESATVTVHLFAIISLVKERFQKYLLI